MAMGKEMQFAIDRFKRLAKQVRDAKLQHGYADPELIKERNNAAAEAVALIKQVEANLSGEWKTRLHALHQKIEKWQAEEGGERLYL